MTVASILRSAVHARLMVLACAVLLCARSASGLDPSLDISQYAHTAWKVRDGFTKGVITTIAQTPDGYLWLGTEFGLYRFDGVRAVPWQPPAGEQLPSNYIRGLLGARDGTLWIATMKGLASWKDGKLTNYPETAGQILFALLQDHDGTIWFGMFAPGRLCAIQGGKVQCSAAGSFGNFVTALYEDGERRLWVAAEKGLWRWKPGPPEHNLLLGDLGADALIEGDSGALLLGTAKGLKQLAGGKVQNYPLPGITGNFNTNRFLRSSDGSLWIASREGLLHLHQGRTDTFGTADGLSGDTVESIFEDREGNVWVSTTEGLDRFREYAFPRTSRNQGLSSSDAFSVQATADGAIWIGTSNGLNRWLNGQLTVYGKQSAPGQSGQKDQSELSVRGPVTRTANNELAGTPRSLGLDDQGRLWVSTSDGVFYFEGERFIRTPGVAGGSVFGIAADGHGKMWISNGELGLFYWRPGGGDQPTPWSRFGQRPFGALALLPDRLQGGLWLGFFQGGVAFFKDGQVRASYTSADGLGNGRVNQLRFGSLGWLWAATEGGLSRIKEGHVATLTSKNGLPCDEVHWSVEDDDHFFWVYMPCGLARVARDELNVWASDTSRKAQLTFFDNSDGVVSVGAYGGYGPHVTKAPDGKIWFVHRDGVSVIDPRHLPSNKLQPPVHIEQITADRKTYDAVSPLRLPSQVRDLEIDYTALSLVAPEKMRFRYKLEGWDKDWQDVGNRRQAFYTGLGPRHYRFRVSACNNDGVWNEEGAALDFAIAPAYYQTMWFRLLCVAAFLALLWGLYRLRLRRVAQQFNMTLEARVGERTRIARELHDTLLQSFQGLLLRFQAVSNLLPGRPSEAKQRLEDAVDLAAQAITEGRDAVQGLRTSTIERNDLADAIETLGEGLAADPTNPNSAAFCVAVEGRPRNLHPIVRDEVFRIAGEGLRNAFRHASAKRIEVEIGYDQRRLRVCIRDDGKGIDPQSLSADGSEGHYGLRGMRERAKLIGGQMTVWSELDSGTEVELSIPAARAYTSSGRRSWFAFR